MSEYEHTQPGTLMRIIFGLLLLTLCAAPFVMPQGTVNETLQIIIAISSAVTCLIILLLFHSLTVRVSDDSIAISFGIGFIHKRFRITEIQSCSAVRNKWYYGWGIKLIPGGWLFNVSGCDAIEICLTNGRRYRIGTDQPQELLAAVQTAITKT